MVYFVLLPHQHMSDFIFYIFFPVGGGEYVTLIVGWGLGEVWDGLNRQVAVGIGR